MQQDHNDLLAKVGQLTNEVDWLKKNLQKCLDLITKKNLLNVHSELSVTRQSEHNMQINTKKDRRKTCLLLLHLRPVYCVGPQNAPKVLPKLIC